MSLCRRLKEIEKIAHRTDLIGRKSLDREVACDNHNYGRMEIISEETVYPIS